MSLEYEIENQPFAVRRVVLASGWRQGLTSLFTMIKMRQIILIQTEKIGFESL